MRIHRALARAGVASRRHAEALISDGRVLINGAPARVGQVVHVGADRVQLDGKEVELVPPRSTWYVLNKPAGYMTTRSDPGGRRTVFELVPDVPSLTYVGRLDFLTEGVLLLTTDGDAAHRLTHPSAEIERVYVATVRGNAKGAAEAARAGVELDDGTVTPAWVNVQPLENRYWAFEVAIREGRTREVRRLCAALGLEVSHLVRTQFGPVRIGQLAPGAWRELSPREAAMLEVFTGTRVPAGRPPRRRDDRERGAGADDISRGSSRVSSRGESQRPRSSRRDEREGDERRPRGDSSRGGSARSGSSRVRSARGESPSGEGAPRGLSRDRSPRPESSRDRFERSTSKRESPSGERSPRDRSAYDRPSRDRPSRDRPSGERSTRDASFGERTSRDASPRGGAAREGSRPDRDASARQRPSADRSASRRSDDARPPRTRDARPPRARDARGDARSKVSPPKRRSRSD